MRQAIEKGHTHVYEPHPSLSTHHYCTVCGFAAPSAVLQPLHLKKARVDGGAK